MMLRILISAILLHATWLHAADVPVPAKNDTRLRVVDYDPDQVVSINIIKGVGTRILLSPSEKIVAVAPGFGGDCAQESSLWCIVAPIGGNDIYVKAKGDAREPNNLEVKTDRHSYSFDLLLNPDFKRERDAMFRVTFRYPGEEAKARVEQAAKAVEDTLPVEPNKPKNWAYSMEVMAGSDVIAPSRVFDDGRFTHLTFPNNRQMPEVFAVEADGSESLAPSHVEQDTVVLHRLYKQMVLRLGKYVVGIWNDAFDADGVAPQEGTTVKGMRRVARGQP